MNGWLKLLVLVAVPILAITMVADPGFAANSDKGSQLIFVVDMGMKNFISITNTSVTLPDFDTPDPDEAPNANTDGGVDLSGASAMAVTVLVQYYDDSITRVAEYLRVIPGGGTVLVDPFNHMAPGIDKHIMDLTGEGDGSRYVIAVTAVRAAEALFPDYLAEDMHETQNIDAVGDGFAIPADHEFDEDADPAQTEADDTTKNVGTLTVYNAQPAAFNYLTGHQTGAQEGIMGGGSDQTASWAMNALTRMAMVGQAGDPDPGYEILGGMMTDDNRLAEVIHGGDTTVTNMTTATGYVVVDPDADGTVGDPDASRNIAVNYGGVNWGALVWSSLHGAGHQEVQLISVADDYGKADEFGDYILIPARTKYKVVPHDAMGRVYAAPDADDPPNFRGGEEDEMDAPSPDIAVSGITVMLDPGDCNSEMMLDGGFSVADLTGQAPGIGEGNDDFTGLNAPVDPMMENENISAGWIKLLRHTQECMLDFGDTDGAYLTASENPDGVPVTDERTLKTGTLVMEGEDYSHMATDRIFVTSGYVRLVYETPTVTFGAAWNLTDK